MDKQVVFENGEWTEPTSDVIANWLIDPVFHFATEVEALQALEALADERRAALEQAAHTMRYIKAAIKAARALPDEERPHPQAILNHTKLARKTVYQILGEIFTAEAD